MTPDYFETTYCLGCRKPVSSATTLCPFCAHDQRQPRRSETAAESASILGHSVAAFAREGAAPRRIPSVPALVGSIAAAFLLLMIGIFAYAGYQVSSGNVVSRDVAASQDGYVSATAALVSLLDAKPQANEYTISSTDRTSYRIILDSDLIYNRAQGILRTRQNGMDVLTFHNVTDTKLRQLVSEGNMIGYLASMDCPMQTCVEADKGIEAH